MNTFKEFYYSKNHVVRIGCLLPIKPPQLPWFWATDSFPPLTVTKKEKKKKEERGRVGVKEGEEKSRRGKEPEKGERKEDRGEKNMNFLGEVYSSLQ